MKNKLSRLWLAAAMAILTGCTVFSGQPVNIGAPEAELIARLGTPTGRYPLDDGHLLEYRRGPWGQQTYMARIGADGRLKQNNLKKRNQNK